MDPLVYRTMSRAPVKDIEKRWLIASRLGADIMIIDSCLTFRIQHAVIRVSNVELVGAINVCREYLDWIISMCLDLSHPASKQTQGSSNKSKALTDAIMASCCA